MKNAEEIAALGAEIEAKLLELFKLARSEDILTETFGAEVSHYHKSHKPGEYSFFWNSHSGAGTCSPGSKTALAALERADREARESVNTVSLLREEAADLMWRAAALERSAAEVGLIPLPIAPVPPAP